MIRARRIAPVFYAAAMEVVDAQVTAQLRAIRRTWR